MLNLCDRTPQVTTDRLLAELVPPPRFANVRFSTYQPDPQQSSQAAASALARLDVDEMGLDALDRRYLRALIENYAGGPAGVETLAYAIAEARDAVEDVIEPFLLQQGFIQRTPRGRMACAKAYAHIGLAAPRTAGQAQPGDLFDE